MVCAPCGESLLHAHWPQDSLGAPSTQWGLSGYRKWEREWMINIVISTVLLWHISAWSGTSCLTGNVKALTCYWPSASPIHRWESKRTQQALLSQGAQDTPLHLAWCSVQVSASWDNKHPPLSLLGCPWRREHVLVFIVPIMVVLHSGVLACGWNWRRGVQWNMSTEMKTYTSRIIWATLKHCVWQTFNN